MYKATYSSIEPAVGERIGVNPHIRMEFFSTRTAYGNHTLEEVLALRVRPLGTEAVDESYTEFPLVL